MAFMPPGKPCVARFAQRAKGRFGIRRGAVSLSCQCFATVFKAPSDSKDSKGPFRLEQKIVPASKKREVRRSVQQTAWVTLEGGFAARECLVHDMSSTGAKITISDSSVLSGRVRLAFSRDANKGRQCQVVWRRGRSFGVKFVK